MTEIVIHGLPAPRGSYETAEEAGRVAAEYRKALLQAEKTA